MPPVGPLAYRVAPAGVMLTPTAGVLPLPGPQASRSPMSTSEKQRPALAEFLDVLRPARPTRTTPARGNVSGSHGERLPALRWRSLFNAGVLGPTVLMVSVTCCGDGAFWEIAVKAQLTVASGSPLQAKVTALAKDKVSAVVTLKVEVVDCPAGTEAGVEGTDKVKS